MRQALYKSIANKFQAMQSCNATWLEIHEDNINSLVNNHMPHGSGIDMGTEFEFEESTPKKLVFSFSYHHMDENGYYDGWTQHKLIITPNLWADFDMRITGPNRNDCKEYFYQVFDYSLRQEVDL
jgi:hypothetical protein